MSGFIRGGPGGNDPGLLWAIQGVGDFDGDGRSDVLWRDRNGQLAIWFAGEMTRTAYPTNANAPGPFDLSWQIQGVNDYDADGRADILWRSSSGRVAIWLMAGGQLVGAVYPRQVDPAWQIKGQIGDLR